MAVSEPRPVGKLKKQILLIDDHPLVRHGLAQLINTARDFEVCGEVGDAQRAAVAVEKLKPDLAIVDLSLGEDDGLDLIKRLSTRHPTLRILVLSMHSESVYAERALRAGAHGYVMKQEATNDVMAAIRRVLDGELHASGAVTRKLVQRLAGTEGEPEGDPTECLTNRELQIFRLIGAGETTRQIAAQLRLSIKTVESHRDHIRTKLQIKTGAQLMRYAVRWLLTPQARLTR